MTQALVSLPGIDVSNYQGSSFDWEPYRGRISYAFIKATEGLTFTDPDFDRNWSAATAIGIVRGAYHFLDPAVSGPQQADRFLTVANPREGDLIMVDVETTGNGQGGQLSPAQVSDCAGGFADMARAKTGAWPVAYTTQNMAMGGYVASLGQCPAFIANPDQFPLTMPLGPWRFVSFEQIGVRGVDTDVFYGDLAQLGRLAVVHPVGPPPPSPVQHSWRLTWPDLSATPRLTAQVSDDGGATWH